MAIPKAVSAQIVPDATLPTDSVVAPGCTICEITAGTEQGGNLFHSFSEFSVPPGGEAYFNNPVTVENIITRVTGNSISDIDGLIAANDANVFLINPNGVFFGPDAFLDIGGSFLATTAERMTFADGTEFIASSTQTNPLLTVTAPVGLGFGDNPGNISGDFAALLVDPGETLALIGGEVSLAEVFIATESGRVELGGVGSNSTVNLNLSNPGILLDYTDVQTFQDVTLSVATFIDVSGEGGGDVQIQGQAVNLIEDSFIYSLALGDQASGIIDIVASKAFLMSGDNTGIASETGANGFAGNINLTAPKVRLENGAFVSSNSFAGGQAGSITVIAPQSLELVGTTSDNIFQTLISSESQDARNQSGSVFIQTGQLIIREGAQISTTTFGSSQAGNLTVIADSIELIGTSDLIGETDNYFSSGLGAVVNFGASGNGGNLNVQTDRLIVRDGAQIAVSTFGDGKAGNLDVTATEFIDLSGASEFATLDLGSSGLFVSAEVGSTGDGGDLFVTAPQLTVRDGAKISADTFGSGRAGSARLEIGQLLVESGGLVRAGSFNTGDGGTLTIEASELVQVTGTGFIGPDFVNSSIFTAAESSGNAGNLFLTAPQLLVTDGGRITVSAPNSVAGNLTVNAEDIRLNQGTLSAVTGLSADAAGGANIFLRDIQLLLLENESLISASALEDANGGNIDIEAEFVIGLTPTGADGSDITANAVRGNGGAVTITTTLLSGLAFRPELTPENDITVTSQFGLAGTFIQNDLDVDPTEGLAELPANVVDPTGLIDRSCDLAAQERPSEFIVTGRGGLPPNPSDRSFTNPLLDDLGEWSQTELVPSDSSALPDSANPTSTSEAPHLQEAQGWMRDRNGRLHLIASIPTDTRVEQSVATCTVAN
ncbi:MAG: two-partner secretion domain-containing protein [Thainema sp.]